MDNFRTPLTSAERIWPILRRELNKVATFEPALTGYVSWLTEGTECFSQLLARRLALGLACPHMTEEYLADILTEGLQSELSGPDAAAKDLFAIRSKDPASRTHAHAFLNYKGFHTVQVARAAQTFWRDGRIDLAAWLSNRASQVFGPDIHPAAQLGAGIMLDYGSGIVIGETAVVEDDVTILQNVTLGGTGKECGDRHPKVR